MQHDDDFSEETLAEFISDYFNGKIKPYLKSEKPPKKQTSPVVTVVGTTYRDIVESDTKDSLIYFHAGHSCKVCKNTYDEELQKFAQEMKNDDELLVARMDTSKNDPLPKFKVEKTAPTIYYRPRGKDSVSVLHKEEPTTQVLKKFVNAQRGVKDDVAQPEQKDEL